MTADGDMISMVIIVIISKIFVIVTTWGLRADEGILRMRADDDMIPMVIFIFIFIITIMFIIIIMMMVMRMMTMMKV